MTDGRQTATLRHQQLKTRDSGCERTDAARSAQGTRQQAPVKQTFETGTGSILLFENCFPCDFVGVAVSSSAPSLPIMCRLECRPDGIRIPRRLLSVSAGRTRNQAAGFEQFQRVLTFSCGSGHKAPARVPPLRVSKEQPRLPLPGVGGAAQ